MKSKHAKFNFEKLGKMKQKSQNIQKIDGGLGGGLSLNIWTASMPNLTLKIEENETKTQNIQISLTSHGGLGGRLSLAPRGN